MIEASPDAPVPQQAAILFEAGSRLREAITGSLNERGRRAIGERALSLASDRLVFASADALEEFTGESLTPFITRTVGSARVPLHDGVSVEVVDGSPEQYRMIFTPAEEVRVALAGIHGRMLERLARDDRQLAHRTLDHGRLVPGDLALSLPAEFFTKTDNRPAQVISGRMRERHAHGSLFVSNPQLRSYPLR